MRNDICDVAPTTTHADLVNRFNTRFNTNYKFNYLQKVKHYLGVKSLDSKFKKGCKCHNAKPLGAEITSRGKTYVKVKGASKEYWEPKNRYMYKKYHGSIPNGCSIIFLNGDNNDYSKDNLIAVDANVQRIMANLNIMPNKLCDKEVTKASIMVAQLYVQIKKVKESKKG